MFTTVIKGLFTSRLDKNFFQFRFFSLQVTISNKPTIDLRLTQICAIAKHLDILCHSTHRGFQFSSKIF